uniref:G-protein coupled receptors family 1 profile domain-containing protein n=1 Tax=Panagrellus redivivus TaxID=6233 RepID=A0A7E4UUE1_PANRE
MTCLKAQRDYNPFGCTINCDGHFYYFHVVNGVIHEPAQPFTTICVLPLIFFLNWNITVVPVNFIYRYLAVCQKYEMSTLTFLGTIALSTIGPLIYVIAIAYGEFRDDHLRPTVASMFIATDWTDAAGDPPNFSVMIADSVTLHTIVIPISALFTYIVVIFCTIEIYRKVRQLREIQGKNHSGKNFQLNLVLVCNAVVPFIVSAIPSGAVQTAKIMGLKVPSVIGQIALLTPWSAVTSPLMALIIVSPFRNLLIRPILKWTGTTKKTGRLFSIGTSNEHPLRSIAPKNQMTPTI